MQSVKVLAIHVGNHSWVSFIATGCILSRNNEVRCCQEDLCQKYSQDSKHCILSPQQLTPLPPCPSPPLPHPQHIPAPFQQSWQNLRVQGVRGRCWNTCLLTSVCTISGQSPTQSSAADLNTHRTTDYSKKWTAQTLALPILPPFH